MVHAVQETLTTANFELELGLWFSEDGAGMEQHASLQAVSARTLRLQLAPAQGIHYSLPVLFDYFHLSAVSVSVHAALISIHQPYLPSPRCVGGRGGTFHYDVSSTTL